MNPLSESRGKSVCIVPASCCAGYFIRTPRKHIKSGAALGVN